MNPIKWAQRLLQEPQKSVMAIASGKGLAVELGSALFLIIICGGSFGMAAGAHVGGMQILETGYKVPLLLLSTFGICVSVMYILNAIVSRRLSFMQVFAIGVVSISVTAIIIGSLAPILLLFSVTLRSPYITHYGFLILMVCGMIACGGISSVAYLYRAFTALDYSKTGRIIVLTAWLLIYQFVGAQMSFMLRPYIGSYRNVGQYEGNFYESIPRLIRNMAEHFQEDGNERR